MESIFNIKMFAVIMMSVLVGCGGGGGGSEEEPGTTPNVIQGNMDVSLVEGLSYESGGESGVTDENGQYSYEEGETIIFRIGDIVIGTVSGRSRISIVNFVAGATDETNEAVINIMRFLVTIDDDNDLSNGIQITTVISNQAIGATVNFAQTVSEFGADGNVTTIVQNLTDVSTASTRTLVTREQAQTALSTDLFTAYSGLYEGSFTGDDSGTWSMTVDENGVISGDGISDTDGNFTITGQVSSDGNASVGSTSTGATFFGLIDVDDNFSGSWTNTFSNDSGTFTGTKQSTDTGGGSTPGGSNPDVLTDAFNGAMAIYNTVSANLANYISPDITLRAPPIAENGAVVPVTITAPGQVGTLWVFVDSNPTIPAARIDFVRSNDTNESVSIRIKMAATGNIIAVFDDGNGNLRANVANVSITIAGSAVDCPSTPCVATTLSSNSVRTRATSGTMRMLVSHPMNTGDYITSVAFSADTVTKSIAYFTPYISQNPYLSLRYPVDATSLSLTTTQLDGQSVTTDITI